MIRETPAAGFLQQIRDEMNSAGGDPVGIGGPSPYDMKMQGREPSSIDPSRSYFPGGKEPGYYGPPAVLAESGVPQDVEEKLFQAERRLLASGMKRLSPTELRVYAKQMMAQSPADMLASAGAPAPMQAAV